MWPHDRTAVGIKVAGSGEFVLDLAACLWGVRFLRASRAGLRSVSCYLFSHA